MSATTLSSSVEANQKQQKHQILLKIDHRESGIKQLIEETKFNLPYVYENLVYGDIQLLNSQGEIQYIFERKSLTDLLASIKDGRYHNQKARLFQQFDCKQLFYIIEGKISWNLDWKGFKAPSNKIIQSSIINTLLRDKICCFFTADLQDTFQLLLQISSRYYEDPSKYNYVPTSSSTTNNELASTEQTKVLTSNTDDATKIFSAILCQIPGLNQTSVSCFIDRWKHIQDMYDELRGMQYQEQYDLLATFKVNNRRISKRIIENVLRFLFHCKQQNS
jgi:ERCC4-type nuclease